MSCFFILLYDIIDNKISGIILRSKAEHVQCNDKNTKYFASLEKKKAESKLISTLNIQGKLTQNPKEIQQAQKIFYSKLYEKREYTHSSVNFFNNTINKLNEVDKNKCEGFFIRIRMWYCTQRNEKSKKSRIGWNKYRVL